MREIIFSKLNNQRWQDAETLLTANKKPDPEILSNLYMQLTDDLAYARTYFPESKTVVYLNQLVLKMHQHIHVSKKENMARIYQFFKYDYPILIHKYYKFLVYSLLIFITSVIIGAFSAANDADYIRLVTSDDYVNKTIENIENGNPLGIYASQKPFTMFVMITLNNIKVALITFGMGALLSLGTGYFLFKNGIMLGAFQYFFHQNNLLWESASGIWMHGTIEIFSIIIAGMAGLIMGSSILFPGTYPRLYSFQRGALDGVKIVAGLIPFFIIAGFIESFLTRHSNIQWLSLSIICISILLITFYFFIYPPLLNKKLCKQHLT